MKQLIYSPLELQELATLMAFEEPSVSVQDAKGRFHNLNGPALVFDGNVLESKNKYQLYIVRDIPVHPSYFEEGVTLDDVLKEHNQEYKSILINIMTPGKFSELMGAEVIHSDIDNLGKERRLLKYRHEGIDFLSVKVVNSTAEPDGTFKIYYLTVHPECRPMVKNNITGEIKLGDAQELTCHNAVASTLARYGYEYNPDIET